MGKGIHRQSLELSAVCQSDCPFHHWRHIFGRDNVAKLIFPVSSVNLMTLTLAARSADVLHTNQNQNESQNENENKNESGTRFETLLTIKGVPDAV